MIMIYMIVIFSIIYEYSRAHLGAFKPPEINLLILIIFKYCLETLQFQGWSSSHLHIK